MTPYDYWCMQAVFFFKQSPDLDLDMVYGHYATKEMFVFDKWGDWKKEGVDHPALSLENTFRETDWYDEFNPHNN